MHSETNEFLGLATRMGLRVPGTSKRLATALIGICRDQPPHNDPTKRHGDAKKATIEMTRCLQNHLLEVAIDKGRLKELALLVLEVSDVILDGGSPKTKSEKIKKIGATAQCV